MRETVKLSSVSGSLQVSLGVHFDADTLLILNPTAYTMVIRTGSQQPPNGIADADYVTGPLSMLAVPIAGREVACKLTSPVLLVAPGGMPTTATITLLANETAPAFGSLPLTGQPVATETVIFNAQISAGTNVQQGPLTLPAGVRALYILTPSTMTGVSYIQVQGRQSTDVFWEWSPLTAGLRAPYFIVPMMPSIDTEIYIRSTSSGPFNLAVFGLFDRPSSGAYWPDGRQRVDVLPEGASALPVQILNAPPQRPSILIIPSAVRNSVGVTSFGTMASLGCGGYATGLLFFQATVNPTTLTPQIYDPAGGGVLISNFNAVAGAGAVWNQWLPERAVVAGTYAINNSEFLDDNVVAVNQLAAGNCTYFMRFYPGRRA